MGEANAVFTPLLEGEYFRAGKIGDGAYGDVLKVFDDDGTAFAAKRFESDEEEGDGSIEAGALREVEQKFGRNLKSQIEQLCSGHI